MFRKITLEDKNLVNRYKYEGYISSELNFANLYSWKDDDNLEIYSDDKVTIIKGDNFFFPPICEPQYFNYGLEIINKYCDDNQIILNIFGVTDEIKPLFPEEYIFYFHPEINEYIYNAQDLITYSGKKFHKKRNLLHQFEKNYSYQFLTYDENYREEIVELVEEWNEKKTETSETKSIFNALDNLEALDCFCDCLFVNDKLVGFSIGTIQNDCGIVLFEKADDNFSGIYAKLVNAFASKHFANVKYINRQEDMGIENLRRSKESYNPAFLTHKYQVTLQVKKQLRKIYEFSFNDPKEYVDYFFAEKRKESKLLFENNQVVSMLFYRDETLILNNKEYKAAFIFAVATHPKYRKQGKMDKLFKHALDTLSEEYTFAYLSSDVGNYYEKYGFINFGLQQKINTNLIEPTKDLNKVLEIYNEYTSSFDLYPKRTIENFQEIEREISVCGGNIYILKDNQLIIGYCIHDGDEYIEYCNLKQKTDDCNSNKMICLLDPSILPENTNLKDFLKQIKAISFGKY